MILGGRDVRVAEEYRSVRQQEAEHYRQMKLAKSGSRSKRRPAEGVLIRAARGMRNLLLDASRDDKSMEVEQATPPQKSPSLEPSG
jgi:hypothetical protein